jgi:hypothetical protein
MSSKGSAAEITEDAEQNSEKPPARVSRAINLYRLFSVLSVFSVVKIYFGSLAPVCSQMMP